MIKKKILLLFLSAFFFLTACSGAVEETTDSDSSALVSDVTVENVVERTVRNGETVAPYITVTVKNRAGTKIYNLTITVTALSISGNIVSGPHSIVVTDFAISDDLDVSDEIAFEVEFIGLTSHDDYARLRFDFDWEVKKAGQVSAAILY